MPLSQPSLPSKPTPRTVRNATITQIDLARIAGVSQKTVHLALHGGRGVKPATTDKIRRLALKHGYRLNAAASAMRSQATRHVGLAVRPTPQGPLTHFSAYETILGADAALAGAGYLTNLVRLTDISPERNSRVFNEVLLDGMLVIDQLPRNLRAPVQRIAPHCVWADTDVWEPTHCIRRDEIWAGRLVVESLASHHMRRIIWMGWAPSTNGRLMRNHYSYPLRLKGVRQAAGDLGLEVIELSEPEMTEDAIFDSLKSRLRRPATAIISYNSPTALMVMNRLAQHGLVAGRHYSLASCDGTRRDDIYLPELTHVTFDRHALGEEAGRMMLASIQGRTDACASRLVRGDWIEGGTLIR